MSSLLFTLAAFLVALGVLITVHELGHFWVARRLGVRVLRFSIGFGRPLWRRVGRLDGTEYVIAAIPLGGYVKMLDEREGPVARAEVDRAFNRQRLAVRAAIVAAGPLCNFLFAILAFWLVYVVGDTGTRPWVGTVAEGSAAALAGFAPGDEVLRVDDEDTPTWETAVYALLAGSLDDQALPVRVRDAAGVERVRVLPAASLARLTAGGGGDVLADLGLTPKRPEIPPVVGEVLPGEAAERAGLRAGDLILSVDEKRVKDWSAWVEIVRAHPGETLHLRVLRKGLPLELALGVGSTQGEGGTVIGRIGAAADIPDALFDPYRVVVQLDPVHALTASVRQTGELSLLMLRMFGKMLTGASSITNLSGPISIAQTAGKSASYGFEAFLKFLALVSTSLAVLNLLPIPVLDGGHLLFYVIEAVKGSPLSDRAQLQGQRVGMAILLALMALAFYVDLTRLLG